MSKERRQELERCEVGLDVWDSTKGRKGEWVEQKAQRGNTIRFRFDDGTALVIELYHHPGQGTVSCKAESFDGKLAACVHGAGGTTLNLGVRKT